MSKKAWLTTLAAVTILAACENPAEHPEKTPKAAETATKDPAAPGDQETTPGGVAGETAATPPGTDPETRPAGE